MAPHGPPPSSCGALGAARIISLLSIIVRQRCRNTLIFVDAVINLSQTENGTGEAACGVGFGSRADSLRRYQMLDLIKE